MSDGLPVFTLILGLIVGAAFSYGIAETNIGKDCDKLGGFRSAQTVYGCWRKE